jgi:hypothetical protein
MNATEKNLRVELIRSRVEARAEYASDFELVPVACIEPGSYILDMVQETLESVDNSYESIPTDVLALMDRINGQYDLLEGFHTLDVCDFVDASFELMGVNR